MCFLVNFMCFWLILGNFMCFWLILGNFMCFWLILGNFMCFWLILGNFMCFWLILGNFMCFWLILGNFMCFLGIMSDLLLVNGEARQLVANPHYTILLTCFFVSQGCCFSENTQSTTVASMFDSIPSFNSKTCTGLTLFYNC